MTNALKLVGATIALLIAGVIAIVIFETVWLRIGLGAALAIVCCVLLLIAWRIDKKDEEAYGGVEDLPDV